MDKKRANWIECNSTIKEGRRLRALFGFSIASTNALMAWNTQHMQRAVEAIEAIEAIGGEPLRPGDLGRIAPTNLEGINLRGTFEFPRSGTPAGSCRVHWTATF
jgi:hypothetical protein